MSGSAITVLALGDSVPAGAACGCEPFPVLYAHKLTADGNATDLAGNPTGLLAEDGDHPNARGHAAIAAALYAAQPTATPMTTADVISPIG